MRIIVYILICFFVQASVYGQEDISFDRMKDFYHRMESFYGQAEYKLDVVYKSFKGHDAVVPEDKSSGFVNKKNEIIESYQMGIYSIQNLEFKIFIDSSELIVGVAYPDTNINKISSLEEFEKSKYNIERIFLEKKGREDCITIIYKRGYQFSKLEMKITQEGMISEVKMFFANYLYYKDDNGKELQERAKIIIEFTRSKEASLILDMQDLVIKKDGKLNLSPLYKNFELIDYRYQN